MVFDHLASVQPLSNVYLAPTIPNASPSLYTGWNILAQTPHGLPLERRPPQSFCHADQQADSKTMPCSQKAKRGHSHSRASYWFAAFREIDRGISVSPTVVSFFLGGGRAPGTFGYNIIYCIGYRGVWDTLFLNCQIMLSHTTPKRRLMDH